LRLGDQKGFQVLPVRWVIERTNALHKTAEAEHLKRNKSHRLNGACRTP
jgi:hypothetical protein